MNRFENTVLNYIRANNMMTSGEKILVGFSGGADSVALLLVLFKLKELLGIELAAVHVNHGIRDEAGDDAEFTQKFCEKRNIDYFLVKEDVPKIAKEKKLTEEEAGRNVRYEAFGRLAEKEGAAHIAVAHHRNDVAETLLLNLLRGTGLHGAGAIRPVRDNVIRPLLCVTRQEIEEYLEGEGEGFCHDVTNDENIHTRNKIRNELIPYMSENINAEAVKHLCRAAADFALADDFIGKVTKQLFDKTCTFDGKSVKIELDNFLEEDLFIQKNVILKCFELLTPNRKDITSSHVDAVMEIIGSTNGTASVNLPYGLVAKREYGILTFSKGSPESFDNTLVIDFFAKVQKEGEASEDVPGLGRMSAEIKQFLPGESIPSSTYTKWFDCDRIQAAVFRCRRADDYIFIDTESGIHKKKLSKFMTDVKIPIDKRDNIYVLADGDHVLWVPGYRISAGTKVSEDTKRILAINFFDGGQNGG